MVRITMKKGDHDSTEINDMRISHKVVSEDGDKVVFEPNRKDVALFGKLASAIEEGIDDDSSNDDSSNPVSGS